jgi:hypothetical protein
MISDQIFLSHSRDDADIRDYFLKIFGLVGFKGKAVEFENVPPPPWIYIKEEIEKSRALFLLLGENVVDRGIYTQNWISFEVGLACQMGKPIWVFEPDDREVLFPVPFFNYYVNYNLGNKESLMRIKTIIEEYAKIKPDETFHPDSAIIKCPCANCGLDFKIPMDQIPRRVTCPACRQKFNTF